MRPVGAGRWVGGGGSVECVNCRDSCLLVGRAMSTVEHNYVIIDGEGKLAMRSKVHSRVLREGLGLKFTKFNGPGQVRAEMSSDCVGPGLKVLAWLPVRPVFGSLFWASSAK